MNTHTVPPIQAHPRSPCTILAFETSCDETAAAVVRDGREVLSSVVRSQIPLHRLYGGVVPEIASRAHIESIDLLCALALEQASCRLEDLDAVAVTAWPGLIGALLVGVNFAKSLAASQGLPLVAVHHLRGHIAANLIAHPLLSPPFLCLLVSGGHTSLILVEDYTSSRTLGRTRDDAVGECFDKVARVLGLPYPGGVALDQLAQGGNASAYRFPNATVRDAPWDFSFSGLKTAAINQLHQLTQKGDNPNPADFAASFTAAVSQALCDRLELAATQTRAPALALAGGVAANTTLRRDAEAVADRLGLPLYVPPLSLCGDNAAMIGAQAYFELGAGHVSGPHLNARATKEL